jgi:hypothetical protein
MGQYLLGVGNQSTWRKPPIKKKARLRYDNVFKTAWTDEVHFIKHYVIKIVSDLRQIGGFLQVLWFPTPSKYCPMEVSGTN